MISEKTILKAIIDELIANDKYKLTWVYDFPELKISIGGGMGNGASKMIHQKENL
jgi:hypothetical protein